MSKTINEHEGKKYLRLIHPADGQGLPINVDVYAVLKAFNVTCPAIAHAVKKLLCCGTRGKGDTLADLVGAEAAVARAIDLERQNGDIKERRWVCAECNNHIPPPNWTPIPRHDGTVRMYCAICKGEVTAHDKS